MRKTKLFLLSLFLLAANITSHAQEEQLGSPHNIAVKVLFLDYATPNSLKIDTLPMTNGIEAAYIRNFNPYLNIAFPVKVGQARVEGFMNRRWVLCVDAILQAQYQKTPKSFFTPYVFGGGSMVYENFEMASLQFPVGVGMNLRLAPNTYLNLQGEYRHSLAENRNNLVYGAGLMFRLVPEVKQPAPPPFRRRRRPLKTATATAYPTTRTNAPTNPACLRCWAAPTATATAYPTISTNAPTNPAQLLLPDAPIAMAMA